MNGFQRHCIVSASFSADIIPVATYSRTNPVFHLMPVCVLVIVMCEYICCSGPIYSDSFYLICVNAVIQFNTRLKCLILFEDVK